MKYTVAIPVLNGEATINHVIEAALQQDPPPEAILVCDDGSSDESALVASNAGARIIFHPHNCGLAGARNSLLLACKTQFIIYFDADAIPQPGCAANLLAPFADTKIAAVGGRGAEVGDATMADRWRARYTPQSHGDRSLDDDWMIMGLCSAFRTRALRSIGGFAGRFSCCGEDVDVSVRLRKEGWRLAYRPSAIVNHARSDGTLGVLHQAYQHAREASRALRCHDQPTKLLANTTIDSLVPALRRDLRSLDLPSAAMTVSNFTARMAGIWVGKHR